MQLAYAGVVSYLEKEQDVILPTTVAINSTASALSSIPSSSIIVIVTIVSILTLFFLLTSFRAMGNAMA